MTDTGTERIVAELRAIITTMSEVGSGHMAEIVRLRSLLRRIKPALDGAGRAALIADLDAALDGRPEP